MDTSAGISSLTWIEAALANRAFFELAELIPSADPVKGGRPRKYPGWVVLLYEGLLSVWRSARHVEAELSHPLIWEWLQDLVAKRYPDKTEWHLPSEPIRRHNWAWIHRKYLRDPEVQSRIADRFREITASQAVDIGLLDPDGPGSWSHPHSSRAIIGDGKVITPSYRAEPGDTRVDKVTGEIHLRKSEPDAGDFYEGGKDEPTRGTAFVMMSARGEEPFSRMILDVEWVPRPGAEAETVLECVGRLRPLVPGAQVLVYDGALRGVHKQVLLRDHGIIPVNRVPAKRASVKLAKGHLPRLPKDAHVEDKEVRCVDGVTRTCRVHAVDGAVGLVEIDERGELVFVELEPDRVRPFVDADGKTRWYSTYKLPTAERFGGGGTLTLRLDQTDEDRLRDFNRTENVSVFPPSSEDFKRLYSLRPNAESINRALDDSLYLARAHSVGHASQRMNLIGYALMVNSLAIYLAKRHQQSTDRPPPGAIAA